MYIRNAVIRFLFTDQVQNQTRIVSGKLPVCPVQILSPRRELRLTQNLNRHKPCLLSATAPPTRSPLSLFFLCFWNSFFLKNAIARMSPRRELKIKLPIVQHNVRLCPVYATSYPVCLPSFLPFSDESTLGAQEMN
jgi:hypothetical protein